MSIADVRRSPGRRRVLGGAAAVALGAVGAPAMTGLRGTPARAATAGAGYLPDDPLLHLLRRASFGPSPESIAEIRALGAAGWLDRQLDPESVADPACADLLQRLPLLGLTIAGVRSMVAAGQLRSYTSEVMRQVGFGALARAVWSRRQLFEVMVDFWSNHLHVTCPSGDVWDSRADYDRHVIRRHAFGRFADLLKASARHPAMLSYLDNRYSTGAAPNENYGRELLELHTVGHGEFSESHVRDAARLLSGLTVHPDTGEYVYDPERHAVGPVSVCGFTRPNATSVGAETAALELLEHLAGLPATARRIARKLCLRFVSDDPPTSLVNRLAEVYLQNRTAIVPVLRALFRSAGFADSVGAKTRTPLEDIVATVRVLGYGPESRLTGSQGLQALYWMADGAGQAPLAWGPPDGYPEVAAAWASPSSQLLRWNAHLNIAGGWWPPQITRPGNLRHDLLGAIPPTYGQLVDDLADRLFSRPLRPEHRSAVTAFFGKRPDSPLQPGDAAVDWSFPHLVALLLNSPYFAVR